jgi:hypothetical protein
MLMAAVQQSALDTANDRFSRDAFCALLAQRPGNDPFLLAVLDANNAALVALSVRILELWDEAKSGIFEQLTFESIMMNLTEFLARKEGFWLQYCNWLHRQHELGFTVPVEVFISLEAYPHHQASPELVLEATPVEAIATPVGVAQAVPSTPANKTKFDFTRTNEHITLSGNDSLNSCMESAIKLDMACTESTIKLNKVENQYALDIKRMDMDMKLRRMDMEREDKERACWYELAKLGQQQQQEKEREDKREARADKKEERAYELEMARLAYYYEGVARAHQFEMARLAQIQQQPSTPPQDSSRQNLFSQVYPADVHPIITPTTPSRKRKRIG